MKNITFLTQYINSLLDTIPGAYIVVVINTAAGISSFGCGYEWPLCMAGMLIMDDHQADYALLCNLDIISQAVQNLYEPLKHDCEKRGNADKGMAREGNIANPVKEAKSRPNYRIPMKFAEKII